MHFNVMTLFMMLSDLHYILFTSHCNFFVFSFSALLPLALYGLWIGIKMRASRDIKSLIATARAATRYLPAADI